MICFLVGVRWCVGVVVLHVYVTPEEVYLNLKLTCKDCMECQTMSKNQK
jgi:hypothetical protein